MNHQRKWYLVKVVAEEVPSVGEIADLLADQIPSSSVHVQDIPNGEVKHYVDFEDIEGTSNPPFADGSDS